MKIEIQNVPLFITVESFSKIVLEGVNGGQLYEIREGSKHSSRDTRSLIFDVNSEGFRHLFSDLNGSINYIDLDSDINYILRFKVSCKPWQCPACFVIGRHSCKGRLCANCGAKSHDKHNCKAASYRCSNCLTIGHRAKDYTCPIYTSYLIRNLMRTDIPMEYYKNPHLRARLIDSMILK